MDTECKFYNAYFEYVLNGVEPEKKEMKAVFNILRDILDRRGLKQAFFGIDADIQDEIIETWAKCISQAL